MQNKILSTILVAVATVGSLTFYYEAKPTDNIAYASAAVGSAFKDLQDSNAQAQALRDLRSRVAQQPKNLLDTYGRDIYEVFASPELIRRDKPTTVWQYRNAFCVLDLYFTTQKDTAMSAPVVHFEARHRDVDAQDQDLNIAKCVKSLTRKQTSVVQRLKT